MGNPETSPPRRPSRAAFAACAAAGGLAVLAVVSRDGPVPSDYWQCDRQCRWDHAFFDRRVVGVEVSSWIPWASSTCNCSNGSAALGVSPYETTGHAVTTSVATFDHAKPFDGDYWCAAFDSPYTCAVPAGDPTRPAVTLETADALADPKWLPLHCGRCGACSSLADAEVLWRTRHTITTNARRPRPSLRRE